MGQQQRRKFNAEFKAEIALQAISGEKSIAELCREHGITGQQVGQWKQVLVQQASELFTSNRTRDDNDSTERVAELERLVGKLTLQLEIAKKASTLLTSVQHNGKR
jgi:transposase-like protein